MAHDYCNGKIIYASPQAAHYALGAIRRRPGRHGQLRVEPQCASCGQWHLTSAPVKRKPARR